ncbi:TetR family transcriptional regulator [Frankia sp. CNm7]|uniref:TetR/AcrR family transcriptional regulator n=1 Tax=Frankia nepalensis TaxID=1836974 RepID=UPI0019337AE2|nr:TetR family transcriptional regulator [Frankia nepalensis]MBL7518021.1 TetR family transcriptional regulator [Frankia nepalensis]
MRAAIRLLAERGYTGTTLAEIGREAGLSRGLVTHHFGGKDACIRAAIEEIRTAAHRALYTDADPALRGLAKVDFLIGAYIDSARAGHPYTRAYYVVMADSISEAPELRDVVAHANEVFRDQIRELLQEAVDLGEAPPEADLRAHAVLLEGLLRGVCLQWYVDPAGVDLDAAAEAAKSLIRSSLRAGLATPA